MAAGDGRSALLWLPMAVAVPEACGDGTAVPAPAALQDGLSHHHLAGDEPPVPQQTLENTPLFV